MPFTSQNISYIFQTNLNPVVSLILYDYKLAHIINNLLQILRYGKAHIGLYSTFRHGDERIAYSQKNSCALYRQVEVFKTSLCSLKTRYHRESGSRIRAIGKMRCVVKKTLKRLNTNLYGLSWYTAIWHVSDTRNELRLW
ncbi:hypothetical protein ACUXG3_004268 [Bacillus thuringiensis]